MSLQKATEIHCDGCGEWQRIDRSRTMNDDYQTTTYKGGRIIQQPSRANHRPQYKALVGDDTKVCKSLKAAKKWLDKKARLRTTETLRRSLGDLPGAPPMPENLIPEQP